MNALIVNNSNPAAIALDQSAGQAQVASEDLLTVVLEHFPTDTANYASFLPPATTQVEHWDLQQMCGPSLRGAHPARDFAHGRGVSQQRHLLYGNVMWEVLLN